MTTLERFVSDPLFAPRFWKRVRVTSPKECWLWSGGITAQGYGFVGHRTGAVNAHRAAFRLSYGPIKEGLFVCHKCDVKLCCNPLHLFSGTPGDNTRDAMRKGLLPTGVKNYMFGRCGESHPNRKLTNESVTQIRNIYATGVKSQASLAKEFNTTQATVSCIVRRVTWPHIS